MIKNKQKTIIIISALVVVAILLGVLYFIISKNLPDNGPTQKEAPTILIDGEGYLLDKITLYPRITTNSLLSLDIVNNVNGVKTSLTSKEGDVNLSIKGYEGIFEFNSAITSSPFLSAITWGVTTETDNNTPIRDCSEE